jgi:hypothetical protein
MECRPKRKRDINVKGDCLQVEKVEGEKENNEDDGG